MVPLSAGCSSSMMSGLDRVSNLLPFANHHNTDCTVASQGNVTLSYSCSVTITVSTFTACHKYTIPWWCDVFTVNLAWCLFLYVLHRQSIYASTHHLMPASSGQKLRLRLLSGILAYQLTEESSSLPKATFTRRRFRQKRTLYLRFHSRFHGVYAVT